MVWPMRKTLAAFIQALDALAIRTLICHCQRSGGADADARQQQAHARVRAHQLLLWSNNQGSVGQNIVSNIRPIFGQYWGLILILGEFWAAR
jgi:hypothetical protein